MKLIPCMALLAGGMLALPARADIHLLAAAGVHVPNGDSARFFERGYRFGAGLELKSDQIGLLVEGAYNRDNVNSAESEKAFRESHPSFPATAPLHISGVAQIYEMNISPKFYLLDTEDIGAFLIAGGGPRWIQRRGTVDLPSPQPDVKQKSSETSLGFQAGFGVEAAFPGEMRLGINPTYHFVFAKHRVEYAALTIYLKL